MTHRDEDEEIIDLIETQAREIERLRGALAKYNTLHTSINARAALAGDSHD